MDDYKGSTSLDSTRRAVSMVETQIRILDELLKTTLMLANEQTPLTPEYVESVIEERSRLMADLTFHTDNTFDSEDDYLAAKEAVSEDRLACLAFMIEELQEADRKARLRLDREIDNIRSDLHEITAGAKTLRSYFHPSPTENKSRFSDRTG